MKNVQHYSTNIKQVETATYAKLEVLLRWFQKVTAADGKVLRGKKLITEHFLLASRISKRLEGGCTASKRNKGLFTEWTS